MCDTAFVHLLLVARHVKCIYNLHASSFALSTGCGICVVVEKIALEIKLPSFRLLSLLLIELNCASILDLRGTLLESSETESFSSETIIDSSLKSLFLAFLTSLILYDVEGMLSFIFTIKNVKSSLLSKSRFLSNAKS